MYKKIIEDLRSYLLDQKFFLDYSCNYESLGFSIYKEILELINHLEKKYRKELNENDNI